jgi:hypothetical protein
MISVFTISAFTISAFTIRESKTPEHFASKSTNSKSTHSRFLLMQIRSLRPHVQVLRDSARRVVALALVFAFVFASMFAAGPAAPVFASSRAELGVQAAAAPMMLHITILDGEDALNDIRERTAREPIVQVEDENHKPVAGALILFSIQNGGTGAGGTFNGLSTLSVTTDAQGRAVAHGLKVNSTSGSFTISVTATLGALVATTVIHQSNVAGAGGAAAPPPPPPPPPAVTPAPPPGAVAEAPSPGPETSSSTPSKIRKVFRHIPKKVWISGTVVVATAVVVGVVVATRGNSPTTITPGTGTVGP